MSQTPGDAQLTLLLARFYARIDRDDAAEKTLRDLMAAHPEDQRYRLELAQFLGEKKKKDAMILVLEGCIKDDPEAYRPCEMLALHYLKDGEYNDAPSGAGPVYGSGENGP